MWTHELDDSHARSYGVRWNIYRDDALVMVMHCERAAHEFCEMMNEYQQRTLPDVPETPPMDAA